VNKTISLNVYFGNLTVSSNADPSPLHNGDPLNCQGLWSIALDEYT